jgi:hypothetical protein
MSAKIRVYFIVRNEIILKRFLVGMVILLIIKSIS